MPRVHDDLTTRRVLAMDRIDGEPIEALAGAGVAQARRDAVGRTLERLVFRELFEFRFMQTDPNFANYLIEPDGGSHRAARSRLGARASTRSSASATRASCARRSRATGARSAPRPSRSATCAENEREDRARGSRI